MRRRDFIVLAGSTVAWPLAALAQQAGKVYRIGFLWDSPAAAAERTEAFRQGLRDLGYVEGRNITIEYRWAEGKPERMRELAEELVRLKVDVIITQGSIYTEAAKRATSTIPIVFMSHSDPVATGHVTSLARPGGNITGSSVMVTETSVKGLELLTQAVPGLARVAVIFDPATPSHGPILKAVEAAAPLLGLQVQPVAVRSAMEYGSAFLAIVQGRADAVLVLPTPMFVAGAQLLAELALTHKLPSAFFPREAVEAGGLMSYSPNLADISRRSAIYVDKILKGANPADLPVQQPTRFQLVVNGVATRFVQNCTLSSISLQHALHLALRDSPTYIIRQRVGGGLTRSGAPCPRALPDYGEAGIHREGHRESSKAKPRRDAASVPKSCERPICRCRGQIGPEGDGWLRGATRFAEGTRPPWLKSPGMVPLCLLLRVHQGAPVEGYRAVGARRGANGEGRNEAL